MGQDGARDTAACVGATMRASLSVYTTSMQACEEGWHCVYTGLTDWVMEKWRFGMGFPCV